MTDSHTINPVEGSVPDTPSNPTQPVFPPVDATKAVPPITPFPAWTWNTPVIPQFYWNVYSAEQRIRQICVEIGRIQAYLGYMAANANAAHWYLDNRFTETETRLTQRIDKLEADLTEEVTRLDKLIADEQAAREAADTALGKRIDGVTPKAGRFIELAPGTDGTLIDNTMLDGVAGHGLTGTDDTDAKTRTYAVDTDIIATKASVDTERVERKQADATLQNNLDNETKTRNNADLALGTRISEETSARTQADATLTNSLNTEIQARRDADTSLGERIDAEATARRQADTTLQSNIDTEASNRQTADNLLTAQVNARVKAVNVKAADDSHINVNVTSSATDPDKTTVTIGDSFTPAFDDVNARITKEITDRTAADSALQRSIDAEIDERRHDDEVQNEQIDNRLKLGAVLAGAGITVTNDPDKTTATIAAEVTQSKLDTAVNGLENRINDLEQAGYLTSVSRDTSLKGNGSDDSLGINYGADAWNEGTATELPTELAIVPVSPMNRDYRYPYVYLDSQTLRPKGTNVDGAFTERIIARPATKDAPGVVQVGEGLTTTSARGTLTDNPAQCTDDTFGTISVDPAYIEAHAGLTAVAHDDSITGTGDSGNPLSVSTKHKGGFTVPESAFAGNTAYPHFDRKTGTAETNLALFTDPTIEVNGVPGSPDVSIIGVHHDNTLTAHGGTDKTSLSVNYGNTNTPPESGSILIAANANGQPVMPFDPDEFDTGTDGDGYGLHLKAATDSTLGGVKIGTGLTISSDGVLSASNPRNKLAFSYELGTAHPETNIYVPAHAVRFEALGGMSKDTVNEVVSNTEVVSMEGPVAPGLGVTVETYSAANQIDVRLRIENLTESQIHVNEYIQAIHVWTSTAYPYA